MNDTAILFIEFSRLTCQSIEIQLFALNYNFLHYIRLIDMFSADEHAEMFACELLILVYTWFQVQFGINHHE